MALASPLATAAKDVSATQRERLSAHTATVRDAAIRDARLVLTGPAFNFPVSLVEGLAAEYAQGHVILTDGTVRLRIDRARRVTLLSPLPPGSPTAGLSVGDAVALDAALSKV